MSWTMISSGFLATLNVSTDLRVDPKAKFLPTAQSQDSDNSACWMQLPLDSFVPLNALRAASGTTPPGGLSRLLSAQ